MELMIVRHSMSVSNHADLISGADNDVDLSTAGVQYAEKVRDAYDWGKYDTVYASPMLRARRTAAIITDNQQPLQVDDRLAELHFGEWEGTSADPIRVAHPEIFDYTGMFNEKYVDFAPGAESHAQLLARVTAFLADLKQTHPNDEVLLVCHGVTIRMLFVALFGRGLDEFGSIANLALNEVHLDAANDFAPRLLQFNRIL